MTGQGFVIYPRLDARSYGRPVIAVTDGRYMPLIITESFEELLPKNKAGDKTPTFVNSVFFQKPEGQPVKIKHEPVIR